MMVPDGVACKAQMFSVWPRSEKSGSSFRCSREKILIIVSWPPVTA